MCFKNWGRNVHGMVYCSHGNYSHSCRYVLWCSTFNNPALQNPCHPAPFLWYSLWYAGLKARRNIHFHLCRMNVSLGYHGCWIYSVRQHSHASSLMFSDSWYRELSAVWMCNRWDAQAATMRSIAAAHEQKDRERTRSVLLSFLDVGWTRNSWLCSSLCVFSLALPFCCESHQQ